VLGSPETRVLDFRKGLKQDKLPINQEKGSVLDDMLLKSNLKINFKAAACAQARKIGRLKSHIDHNLIARIFPPCGSGKLITPIAYRPAPHSTGFAFGRIFRLAL